MKVHNLCGNWLVGWLVGWLVVWRKICCCCCCCCCWRRLFVCFLCINDCVVRWTRLLKSGDDDDDDYDEWRILIRRHRCEPVRLCICSPRAASAIFATNATARATTVSCWFYFIVAAAAGSVGLAYSTHGRANLTATSCLLRLPTSQFAQLNAAAAVDISRSKQADDNLEEKHTGILIAAFRRFWFGRRRQEI
ncbi:conserved hypothetical protein [Trichinella spiralis]|uniref:hypothetical protein n=1 Tax=Trichinella spiralis TaxID=6334 RepID=UPI0001EFBF7D|nr:conserved hypothetical protein [Trichinella spiralis]